MNEYNAINAYLHLIYGNETTFLQRLLSNYDNYQAIKELLIKKDPIFSFLNDVSKEQFTLFQRSKTLETMEAFFSYKFTEPIRTYQALQQKKYQVVFLHGFDPANTINQYMVDQSKLDAYQNDDVNLIYANNITKIQDLNFNAPTNAFLKAMYQIDKWPGILVIKEEQSAFYPIEQIGDTKMVFCKIADESVFFHCYQNVNDSYFVHLSDLHLGTKNKRKGQVVLQQSLQTLYHHIHSNYPIKFLITGDLMNSPNRKNMNLATSFMNMLKREFKGDVTFILGNHDVIVNGLNLFKRQKTKVVAYLLGENIKVLEKEKIILIKVNSLVEGNLARGEIGLQQLDEIDEELSLIEHLEDYTLMLMLHHHVLPIQKDEFLKTKWNEKYFVGKLVENSKALVDAPLLLDWAKHHHIAYIFHGHKHLPFLQKQDGLYVIAGGSSCGGGAKESKSRYLSYNVLKYDHLTKKMKYCFIFYDDMTQEERQRIIVHLF